MEAVVLQRVGFLEYFCPKEGQDFNPSTALKNPNMGQSPPPPPRAPPLSLLPSLPIIPSLRQMTGQFEISARNIQFEFCLMS